MSSRTTLSTTTRGGLEEAFLELCDRYGLPRPAVNARIAGYEVDFHWPAAGLIVETDHRRHHGTGAAFERDRARDQELAALGWRVVRITNRQLASDPARLAGLLRSALSARSPSPWTPGSR